MGQRPGRNKTQVTGHRSQVIVLAILKQPKTMTCDLCFVPAGRRPNLSEGYLFLSILTHLLFVQSQVEFGLNKF